MSPKVPPTPLLRQLLTSIDLDVGQSHNLLSQQAKMILFLGLKIQHGQIHYMAEEKLKKCSHATCTRVICQCRECFNQVEQLTCQIINQNFHIPHDHSNSYVPHEYSLNPLQPYKALSRMRPLYHSGILENGTHGRLVKSDNGKSTQATSSTFPQTKSQKFASSVCLTTKPQCDVREGERRSEGHHDFPRP